MAVYSLVLSDNLQEELHKFRNNEDFDQLTIQRLLQYYKAPVLTNTNQLTRIGRNTNRNLEITLRKSGYTTQPLDDLANKTLYKVILCTDKSTYPYVNINQDKIENNLSGCFFKGEDRQKAILHIRALCHDAESICIYDKHFSKSDGNVDILKGLLPTRKLTLIYDPNHINNEDSAKLKSHCPMWDLEKKILPGLHDRYLVIDEKIEIILTSGFSYLGSLEKEMTYIVRAVSQNRF